MKVVVIGLDGLCWDIIEKYDLPNIERIAKDGVKGDLESCLPFTTFPAWRCYSSGKNPGKLGVYYRYRIDFEKQKLIFHNSLSFMSEEFWDYLSRNGKKVGVCHMPGTYPPKKLNGFMISGPPGPYAPDRGFAQPDELEEELEKYGYQHKPDISVLKNLTQFYEWIEDMINAKFRFTEEKLENFDFLHLTIFYTDYVLHYSWLSEKMGKLLKLIDRRIGELLKRNVNVFLISDHGMGEQKGIFCINLWLEKRGYLMKRKDIFDVLYKLVMNRSNLYRFLERVGMLGFMRGIVLEKTKRSELARARSRARRGGIIGKEWLEKKINWKKTRVMATGQGLVYINPSVRNSEKKNLISRLKSELLSLVHPNTGEPIIRRVFEFPEIYAGPYLDKAPDLIAYQNDGYEISDRLPQSRKIFWKHVYGGWMANHRINGMFGAFGPDIKKSEKELENLKIYDLAPTILHMFGLPVPKDMDGKVLKEIFTRSSEPSRRTVKYCKPEKLKAEKEYEISPSEEEMIKERLRALGYIE